jgi:hypothetical protein
LCPLGKLEVSSSRGNLEREKKLWKNVKTVYSGETQRGREEEHSKRIAIQLENIV